MSTDVTRGTRDSQCGRRPLARLFLLIALIPLVLIVAAAKPAHSIATAETNNASVWLEGPGQVVPGQTIAYDIRTDALGLYGIQFDISFDPAVLQAVGAQLSPGSCPAPDFVAVNLIDNSTGAISYAATALNPTPPCDGGIAASLQFQVSPTAAEGSTLLQFGSVILSDVDAVEIPATPTDLSLAISQEVALSANFSGTPLTGPAPLTVTFTNLSSGPYTACTWSFGDGSGSTSCLNQSHTYTTTGRFTVSLTVEDAGSSDNETKTDYIAVVEQYNAYIPVLLTNYP